ncbi:hypothetical protein B0H13DRAFT_1866888 [Mycena leptocephala]|nr:hypothetical protein B0H13DRAFT_1866888 [Mycena leptocephala]
MDLRLHLGRLGASQLPTRKIESVVQHAANGTGRWAKIREHLGIGIGGIKWRPQRRRNFPVLIGCGLVLLSPPLEVPEAKFLFRRAPGNQRWAGRVCIHGRAGVRMACVRTHGGARAVADAFASRRGGRETRGGTAASLCSRWHCIEDSFGAAVGQARNRRRENAAVGRERWWMREGASGAGSKWVIFETRPAFRMEVSEDTATDPPVNSLPWLDNLLRQKCGIPSLYPHQLAHGKDLNDGRELFLVIATGLGKSIVLFAPLIAAQARQECGIAFMIVPTKVLAEQQAEVGRKYGLKAIAINEDSMLQGRRIGKLLNDPEFKVLVGWMLIDEAHVLDEDSGTFREPYRSILHMRPRVPSNTVWGATTELHPSAALRSAAALGFRTGQYVNARYTIDRPNIKYIPRFFQHPTSGFEFMDFSFVVPFEMKFIHDILLTLIFEDNQGRLRPHPISRLINTYNNPDLDYRRKFIADINDGSVLRIGIVTDTCTYGTDIPKLGRVIIAHIGDSMGDSPEVRKHRWDVLAAMVPCRGHVYAPAWVRDVPESEVTTKQGLLDLERAAASCCNSTVL